MEAQTVLDVITELRQQPNTLEQNIKEFLPQDKFNQRNHNNRNKDRSREEQHKKISKLERTENNVCGKSL